VSRLLIVLFAICALAEQARAHEQKLAMTEILINDRTGLVEVAHRFILHDAEAALNARSAANVDLVASADDRAEFAAYVAASFQLLAPRFPPPHLTVIGTEIKDGSIWVYQEMPIGSGADMLIMRHDALRDIWSEQVNAVIIRRNGDHQTLIFSDSDKIKTAVLAVAP